MARLEQARKHFDSANDLIESAALTPLRLAPVIGRQLDSVDELSSSAAGALGTAADGLREIRTRLTEVTDDPSERLQLLSDVSGLVGRMRASLDELDLGPRSGLWQPLADARNEVNTALRSARDLLDDTETALAGISEVLRGPSRYLVLATNNAEMRAGSGMVLSVGVAEIDSGQLTMGEFTQSAELRLPPGAVTVEGDVADRWGWADLGVEWRDLALTPRFDVTARTAMQMWAALGNEPVDGVIAVDPVALRSILRATGPVRVGTRRVGAGNVVEYLLNDQYLTLTEPGRRDLQEERLEQLDLVTATVLGELTAGRVDMTELIEQLVIAGQGRHLMVWSADAEQNEAWTAARADGAIGERSLLLSLLNRGENKLDYFVDIRAEITVEEGSEEDRVRVLARFENNTPPGEPDYVAGARPHIGVGEGEYYGIAALTMPGAATDAYIEGEEQLAVVGPDGPTRVVGTWVRIPAGQSVELEFVFDLPAGADSLRVEPSARARPIEWSYKGREWGDGRPRELSW